MDEAAATLPEYFEALDGYVPWLAATAVLVAYRKQVSSAVHFIADGVRQGRSAKVGPLEIGEARRLVVRTSDLPDVKVEGNPDHMVLLMKAVGDANGRSFTKSTKALEVDGGCLVQVSTEVTAADGSLSAAEALSFVPGVRVQLEEDGVGGTLVSSGA